MYSASTCTMVVTSMDSWHQNTKEWKSRKIPYILYPNYNCTKVVHNNIMGVECGRWRGDTPRPKLTTHHRHGERADEKDQTDRIPDCATGDCADRPQVTVPTDHGLRSVCGLLTVPQMTVLWKSHSYRCEQQVQFDLSCDAAPAPRRVTATSQAAAYGLRHCSGRPS